MIIFKQIYIKASLTDHAPPGILNTVSENSLITSLFRTQFVKFVKPWKGNEVLLIQLVIIAIPEALIWLIMQKRMVLSWYCLPRHTSHKLKPINSTFFKPLNVAFNTVCMSWMRLHPARRISIEKLGKRFNTAYVKTATVKSAVNSFRCAGLVSFNF